MPTTRAADIALALRSSEGEELCALIERYGDDPRVQVRNAVEAARKRLSALDAERERVAKMYATQVELGGPGLVVGVDEVGRGAIAGPLCVCAVALPSEPMILYLNDSKQLTPKRREEVAAEVRAHALAIGIAYASPEEIDAHGMAACLKQAMADAIADTGTDPDCVLIDGNPVHVHERERCVVKGDARIAAIAAASCVAKVTRDHLMCELDEVYPGYHLAQCKGYGSAEHINAIKSKGLTPIHRASFCGGFMVQPTLF